MAEAPRLKTLYEKLEELPEGLNGEIIDDQLYTEPRPRLRHAVAASNLGADLIGPYSRGRGGPGGWWILDEPEIHFGEHVVVPDLAGWRRERLAAIPDDAYFSLAPDWVCEVLSPSTEKLDRARKLRIYAQAGVEHAWLVKPTDRTLEVLRLREGAWTIVGFWEDAAVVRVEPFEAIELELGRLWAEPAPKAEPSNQP
jgi:Uma2 family endonuclease